MKKSILNHVRSLRNNMTDAEHRLWYHLRGKRLGGYKFRRQHLIYPYVVDFICLSKNLIIECDGGQHLEQKKYDHNRTIFLEARGYKVIRFWNDIILKETSNVLDVISETLKNMNTQQAIISKPGLQR